MSSTFNIVAIGDLLIEQYDNDFGIAIYLIVFKNLKELKVKKLGSILSFPFEEDTIGKILLFDVYFYPESWKCLKAGGYSREVLTQL